MSKVIVRAPVRADLAGGTLDLWPLYLFHPGSRTVNVAISFYAESEVEQTGGGAIDVHLTDQQYRQRYESLQELSADPKAALIYRALEHFHLTGISITTRTDAPRGSGLGGSSALSVTLVRALSEIAGKPVEGEALIALVRDLETRLLGVPAGIQDYYPPVFGGLSSLHLNPGAPARHPILGASVADLASHMILHYTGVSHFSGTNNWELYKRQIDGKKKVQRGLAKIATTSIEMEKALEAGNFEIAGAVLKREWEHRKALIDGISTPEIEAAIDAAIGAGAWGGKVCGAGGGGCIVFLFPPDKRKDIERALANVPGKVLDAAPVQHGMTVHSSNDSQSAPASRPHVPSRQTHEIEQLYMRGVSAYKPFILAEGLVTYIDPRSGIHHTVTKAFLARPAVNDSLVNWTNARSIDATRLDIGAVPDEGRSVDQSINPETLIRAAVQSEESFKQFIADTERLRIFQNNAFGIYSAPGESREAFVARCMEMANKQLDDESERLESTFRRRMDQLRERSEREDRERDHDPGETSKEEARHEVNVSWGQTLYNITSGRPAAVSDAPQSAREVDYMENIAQIQKVWDRELQTRRDALYTKAGDVEDMTIAPTAKNVEVTKYLIVWSE